MAKNTKQQEPAYLRPRGLYWRSVSALLVFQAVGWGCAAGLAYLILSPALAKDYFSAHRTVKATWQLVVPALAISAGVGFLVVGIGSALSVWSHSRRLLEPLRRIDALLGGLAAGRIPRPGPAAETPGAEHEVAVALDPLRAKVEELQRIAAGNPENIPRTQLPLRGDHRGHAQGPPSHCRQVRCALQGPYPHLRLVRRLSGPPGPQPFC